MCDQDDDDDGADEEYLPMGDNDGFGEYAYRAPTWHTVVAVVAILLVLIAWAWAANATPADGGHGIYHEWFAKQMVPNENLGTPNQVSCCAESDGHILEDDDWKISGGEYRVRTGKNDDGSERWTVFSNTGVGKPGNTILDYNNNPTGKPVAWWTHLQGVPVPRCFAPGTES